MPGLDHAAQNDLSKNEGKKIMLHMIRLVNRESGREWRKTHKRICAWCHRVTQEGVEPATHGICPVCAEKEINQYLEGLAHLRVSPN